jgi:hypothetical protein
MASELARLAVYLAINLSHNIALKRRIHFTWIAIYLKKLSVYPGKFV